MIAITLEEKNVIRERYPNVHIVRTVKGDSKRHHYYCTEERGVMRYLRMLRGCNESRNTNRNGGR